MSARRKVRIAFATFIILNAVALTYPGFTPFNHARPFIFGLPFPFAWVTLWILLGLVMLVIADLTESP